MILPNLGDGHDQACQRSDHLGRTQTGQLLEQSPIIPCSFCPGLEIIGLQSKIGEKKTARKVTGLNKDKLLDWTTAPYPHHGGHQVSSTRCGEVPCWGWGTVGTFKATRPREKAMNVVRAGRRVSSTVSQCRHSPHLLVVFTSQTTPLRGSLSSLEPTGWL